MKNTVTLSTWHINVKRDLSGSLLEENLHQPKQREDWCHIRYIWMEISFKTSEHQNKRIPPPPNSLVTAGKTTWKGKTSVPQFIVTKAGRTEHIRSSSDNSELYSADSWFESRAGHGLSWLSFCLDLFSPSTKILGEYLRPILGHDVFLPHSFQFTINYHPIFRYYMAWVTDNIK
jgi:hypothetical protein